MKTPIEYQTIKVPFFNNFNGKNEFKIIDNKFIINQNNSKKLEFIMPKNHKQQLDFESDLTITYQIIDKKFHLINIDVLYSDEYIQIMESGCNLYPELVNGYIKFNKYEDPTNLNTAC
jgi:hypothetical protein